MERKSSAEQGKETRRKILAAVIAYIQEHGYSPTVREIADMVGIGSTSTIHAHLQHMFRTGELETDAEEAAARAIRVPGYVFVKADK